MDKKIESIKYKVAVADYELKKLKAWLRVLELSGTDRYPTIGHYKGFCKILDLRRYKNKKLNSTEVVKLQSRRITEILADLTEIHGHSPVLDYMKDMNFEIAGL